MSDNSLAMVELRLEKIEDTHERIAVSLERLVRLETMHGETREGLNRAFKATERLGTELEDKLEAISERLKVIEERQPVTNVVVYTVGLAVLGALAAGGTALLKVIGLGADA